MSEQLLWTVLRAHLTSPSKGCSFSSLNGPQVILWCMEGQWVSERSIQSIRNGSTYISHNALFSVQMCHSQSLTRQSNYWCMSSTVMHVHCQAAASLLVVVTAAGRNLSQLACGWYDTCKWCKTHGMFLCWDIIFAFFINMLPSSWNWVWVKKTTS